MKQTTITLFLNPECEMYFWILLQKIDQLPIENEYKWNPKDIQISKAMISNWVWVNVSIDLYLKFSHSFIFNNGKFI